MEMIIGILMILAIFSAPITILIFILQFLDKDKECSDDNDVYNINIVIEFFENDEKEQ